MELNTLGRSVKRPGQHFGDDLVLSWQVRWSFKCQILLDFLCGFPLFKQEKSTNCGTKAADVPDTFLAGRHNANQLNILVHLQLLCTKRGNELGLVTSQRQSI